MLLIENKSIEFACSVVLFPEKIEQNKYFHLNLVLLFRFKFDRKSSLSLTIGANFFDRKANTIV